ncbi:Modulator of FtsH protease HflC [Roseivivax sp. THAF40]|uniref:protease modulator HflC n=1 Tax=unclassified Roseivivax TaxID=2639302 RepID=UPI001269177C|nr:MULTISPECIES: protease modulator HflC [unclassified Roseivivax]QFS82052.1 Modulator of FtsH protease HflC [Roseivivax sp. THAF197b]QFT45852.1 Modulator of FtsH protease HflC [Roseivivax sp. THAF40]
MSKLNILIGAAVLVVVGILSAIFIVDEREKALVLQFGQIKQVREEPGIGFKVPFIQEVVKYDDRILSLDTETIEVTPSDDRRLVVDAFARYRISDVVQFRQAVGVGGIRAAEDRLSSILNAQIREVLGADQVTSDTILSTERRSLAVRIREQARTEAASLGLQIVDVRLKQTNLPQQNLDATFARMRAEREREAADEIARGNEAAQRVRAAADRTVVETTSQANREADIVRGEADAERNSVYAEAFGDNPEFFSFYRSLSALERTLQTDNSTLVMSPNSDLVGPLFDAIRAEGLSAVSISNTDIERLRELAPDVRISPDLPDSARDQLAPQDDTMAPIGEDETLDVPLGATPDDESAATPEASPTEEEPSEVTN